MHKIITATFIAALFASPAMATSAGSMSGSTDHFSKNPACYVNGELKAKWFGTTTAKECAEKGGVWRLPGEVVPAPITAPVQDTPRGSNSGSAAQGYGRSVIPEGDGRLEVINNPALYGSNVIVR